MNDDARAVLIDLVATQPPGFVNDHARVEAYLRDLAPGHKTEVRCLVAALDEGIVERLRNGDPAAPVAARVMRLGNDLADQLAMRPDAAQWAVESWAQALGLMPQRMRSGEATTPTGDAGSGAGGPSSDPASGTGVLPATAQQAGASGQQPAYTPELAPVTPVVAPRSTSSDAAAASRPRAARRRWVRAWPLVAAFPVSVFLAHESGFFIFFILTIPVWLVAVALTAWRLHCETRLMGALLGLLAAGVAGALLWLSVFTAISLTKVG